MDTRLVRRVSESIFRKTADSANDEKSFLKTQSDLSAAIAPK
jgi:hypothetical protein